MKDLFFSELRRFRSAALITALSHLLLLLFLNRTLSLLQLPYFEGLPLLLGYILLGLALALWQVGSYRKPSAWLWLMHRPLAPARIFAALAGAALALLVFAILLPQLLYVLGMDLFTQQVVESRHYLTLGHVLAFALMAWLAGCHAILSRHKAAIAVLVVPLTLTLHLISVWWLLLPVLITLACFYYIALHGFRADRAAPLQRPVALLLTALPLQLGIFLLLFQIGKMGFVAIGLVLGVDPNNTAYPPAGGFIEVAKAEPKDEIILGLKDSKNPRAAIWRAELPLLEPVRIAPFLTRLPLRHQLGVLNIPSEWEDKKRSIVWTFSHDRMLFHGRDARSGADRGWWGMHGAGDTAPFSEVPAAGQEGFLLTRSALYAIDEDAQQLHEVLRLPAGESFTETPRRALGRLLVLSNQRLRVYRDDRQATSTFAPPLLDWQLPLPRGAAHLESVTLADLMDGTLVSFVYDFGIRQIGFSQFNVVAEPWQQIVHLSEEGRASVVAERVLKRDYPVFYNSAWWLSPLLHTFTEWPDSALDKGLTWPLELDLLPKVAAFYALAAVLMLLSLLLGAWWLRGAAVSPARRRVWLASCALLGVPAFLSLICMEGRSGNHDV